MKFEMSLFDKLASGLSGQNQNKTASSHTTRASNYSTNQPKQICWQCRYCGRRTNTWSNSSRVPDAGICDARGKVNGRLRPHEWHKVG